METIRTVDVENGNEARTLAIVRRADGSIGLRDPADTLCDSIATLADDSNTSVADAIRDNGWELATGWVVVRQDTLEAWRPVEQCWGSRLNRAARYSHHEDAMQSAAIQSKQLGRMVGVQDYLGS